MTQSVFDDFLYLNQIQWFNSVKASPQAPTCQWLQSVQSLILKHTIALKISNNKVSNPENKCVKTDYNIIWSLFTYINAFKASWIEL